MISLLTSLAVPLLGYLIWGRLTERLSLSVRIGCLIGVAVAALMFALYLQNEFRYQKQRDHSL